MLWKYFPIPVTNVKAKYIVKARTVDSIGTAVLIGRSISSCWLLIILFNQ